MKGIAKTTKTARTEKVASVAEVLATKPEPKKAPVAKRNKGTLARGRNTITTCTCCQRQYQTHTSDGQDVCPQCYESAGEANAHLDGLHYAGVSEQRDCPTCQGVECMHVITKANAPVAEPVAGAIARDFLDATTPEILAQMGNTVTKVAATPEPEAKPTDVDGIIHHKSKPVAKRAMSHEAKIAKRIERTLLPKRRSSKAAAKPEPVAAPTTDGVIDALIAWAAESKLTEFTPAVVAQEFGLTIRLARKRLYRAFRRKHAFVLLGPAKYALKK